MRSTDPSGLQPFGNRFCKLAGVSPANCIVKSTSIPCSNNKERWPKANARNITILSQAIGTVTAAAHTLGLHFNFPSHFEVVRVRFVHLPGRQSRSNWNSIRCHIQREHQGVTGPPFVVFDREYSIILDKDRHANLTNDGDKISVRAVCLRDGPHTVHMSSPWQRPEGERSWFGNAIERFLRKAVSNQMFTGPDR